ncbi:MAG: 16S rRNA (cytosine(1402)-N(4))-methyltransferase [Candidatus Nephthysia bennettiae]|uniref:Ribosomal RNA small subunit methyltransferase H n=1 Tax=Candidatus Nephthysia bennettiae TaxID=3127016 RepID=A0A934KDJ0_9BACT|nr:16S rRNA (cytosine(1402)-N(4))-methyltransferase RsmH [Candidatus Dormibacteraeota bacterium]MBJ7611366.1 16S rRNA (cytosine(1402)-N(4))-methyltransferase RsmH [Candidatus Dormibacteraeota bacterium]PZR91837.1 MAG: 16S rRNA (cytosine(1402)-N(4))-methyltransferase [Candidatus Dormibacteraeota bacterium]
MHLSVLSQESIELLEPRPGQVLVDCTLGAGGHSRLLLERISPNGRLLAIDRDEAAVAAAEERLGGTGSNPVLVHADFAEVARVAREAGFERVDGVLFDLGLSSDQLDDPRRGFSFRLDGPLDMRMDAHTPVTAERVVNEMSERDLATIIRRLGEERWAARIARFIAERRPLKTTREVAAAVEAAIPRGAWPPDIHPATRTFQALRMHVNDELGSLESGLRGALDILGPGGRMVVISFHSLEDATVKRFFAEESRDCLCPPRQPVCTCAHRASLRVLTRKPVRPTAEEVSANPRSRSARLRAAERL